MTETEYQSLLNKLGEQKTKELIEKLSLYKQSSGKSYYSDYATILKWHKEDLEKEKTSWLLSNSSYTNIITDGAGLIPKGMFIWTIPGYTNITSHFGMRVHPITRCI